ncbi:MAG: hypothetical protein DWQ10_08080 [Calditrichaeota bacterium]|nr:MAG: hypothetical protein DWQ10_08080 [Calditrichota bacterium]
MNLRKKFCFYLYLFIFQACSLTAQDENLKTNVQYVREQLVAEAVRLLTIPELEQFQSIVILSKLNERNQQPMQYWLESVSEAALEYQKTVFLISNPDDSLVTNPENCIIEFEIQQWKFLVKEIENNQYVQQFHSEIRVFGTRLKHEVILSRLLTIDSNRMIADKRQLEYVQSEAGGFAHSLPERGFRLADAMQTLMVTGAVLGTVMLLFHYRSQ